MSSLAGIPVSPGIALGPAHILTHPSLDVPEAPHGGNADTELQRFHRSVATSTDELKAIHAAAEKKLRKQDAEIFSAHLLMLDDPALIDAVVSRVRVAGLTAESAVAAAVRDTASQFDAMDDPYFRERAADVRDIGRRILKNLSEVSAASRADAPGVLVTGELLPSDTVALDAALTAGIATEKGGATSHASILARSLGIPCVVGVAGLLDAVRPGDEIALDGATGEIFVNPDADTKKRLTELAEKLRIRRETARKKKDEPARARDGRRVAVYANAASADDISAALENGAEGVGLFRTEFLFLDRAAMPSEDEQAEVYARAVAAAQGRPISVRLLDIGGDKPARYLQIPQEMNPFLGLRAVRLLLERPDVLRAQIRAILRAAPQGNLSILVPMISDPAELEAVRRHIVACRAELESRGVPAPPVPLGVMIEVPAAALCAPALARIADYFSIGTNDLTQYCLAVDRGNPAVASLYRPTHPSVLRLIDLTVRAAHDAGIKVSVCGEAGSDPAAVPHLVNLGVDTLSVAAAAVPDVKELVRNTDPAPVPLDA